MAGPLDHIGQPEPVLVISGTESACHVPLSVAPPKPSSLRSGWGCNPTIVPPQTKVALATNPHPLVGEAVRPRLAWRTQTTLSPPPSPVSLRIFGGRRPTLDPLVRWGHPQAAPVSEPPPRWPTTPPRSSGCRQGSDRPPPLQPPLRKP